MLNESTLAVRSLVAAGSFDELLAGGLLDIYHHLNIFMVRPMP